MNDIVSNLLNHGAGFSGFAGFLGFTAGQELRGVVGEKCEQDVITVANGLNHSQLWSYAFLDASTKIPNGILTGNLIDLGNFDECLEIKFSNSETRGQHCLASISLRNSSRNEDSLGVLPSLLWSYCIPSTCSSQDLQRVLNNTWSSVGASVNVFQTDCKVLQADSFDAAAIFGMCFVAAFALLCVLSTSYDVWIAHKIKPANGIFLSFSLWSNTRRLVDTASDPNSMKPLNGLRFLSIAWIILGHRYYFQTTSVLMNLVDFSKAFKNIDFQLIAGGELAVDTFFILSGLLNAYYLMKMMDSTRSFPIFKYYFHRYIRTTPALAAMILIYATWFVHIGNGPLWDRTIQPWQQMCQENWWVNLLYINNYYHPVAQCAGQSWYLAVDMQLYWLSPLFILPCWKWPRIKKAYLSFLLIISIIIPFVVVYLERIRMPFTISQDLEEYKKVTQTYQVPTHTRATPYIMGIMLGLFLYQLRKSNSKPSVAKWVVVTGWMLSTGLCLSAILGNYPLMLPEKDHPYNRVESSIFIAFYKVAWGGGLSWIIFACLYGYGGVVNSFLSWDMFLPLSRLTYCIFLTHLSVQQYQLGSARTTAFFSDFEEIHRFCGDLVISLATSVALCLMFESPVMVLEKQIQKRKITNGHDNQAYEEEVIECKIEQGSTRNLS